MPMTFRVFQLRRCAVLLTVILAWSAAFDNRAAALAGTNSPTLTSAEQIHRLSRQEAATGRHVLIRGVVTCTLPQFDAAVVQDGPTGIYLKNVTPDAGNLPQVGELVEVEGTTDPGDFAPRIQTSRITRLGAGELPAPVHPYWDQMINGSLDTEFVEIEGIVTSVLTNGVTLRTHDGKINVLVHAMSGGTNQLASKQNDDALIRIRGCLFASWDKATRHVKVSEVYMYNPFVTVVEPAPKDVFADALKSVPDLLLFDPR